MPGRAVLEQHRQPAPGEPPQMFYAGLAKPREATHDAQLSRVYAEAAQRLHASGCRVRRVVMDYELKRDYQRFLQETNRAAGERLGTAESIGRRRSARGRTPTACRSSRSACSSRTCGSSTSTRTAVWIVRISSWRPAITTAVRWPRSRPRASAFTGAAPASYVPGAARRGGIAVRSAYRRKGAAMTFADRIAAVATYGFTPRQAAFLTTVMLHAGVCVSRQYTTFAHIVVRPEYARFPQAT